MAYGSVNSLDYGPTYVVNPIGVHTTTIVWLHDIGQTGLDSYAFVLSLRLPNVKWIFPTAPVGPVTYLGGRRTTAWFDVYSTISEGMHDDLGWLEYNNYYVALYLSYEPPNVRKGVGGFGMGAAQALFYASSYAFGRILIPPTIVIGINGWLPDLKNLQVNMSKSSRSHLGAASLRILITHGISSSDTVPATYVLFPFVKKCVDSLRSQGFPVTFEAYGSTPAPVITAIRLWFDTVF